KVADGDSKEEPANEAEHRVAEIFMQRRHSSGLDLALEAVAHDEIVALLKLGEETGQVPEVIAGVGIGHQDILATSVCDAGHQRGSIASHRYVDDAGAL